MNRRFCATGIRRKATTQATGLAMATAAATTATGNRIAPATVKALFRFGVLRSESRNSPFGRALGWNRSLPAKSGTDGAMPPVMLATSASWRAASSTGLVLSMVTGYRSVLPWARSGRATLTPVGATLRRCPPHLSAVRVRAACS